MRSNAASQLRVAMILITPLYSIRYGDRDESLDHFFARRLSVKSGFDVGSAAPTSVRQS